MFVVVEGAIAAGKTACLNHIAACTSLPVVPEPVAEWTPLLERFYRGEAEAFLVQTKIMADLVVDQRDGVYERCAWTQPWTFSRVLRDEGRLSAREHALLLEANRALARRPDVLIYLRCEPREALRRLRARGRECERDVSLDYMERVHDAYEEMAADVKQNHPGVAVHVLDVTRMSAGEVASTVGYFLTSVLDLPPR